MQKERKFTRSGVNPINYKHSNLTTKKGKKSLFYEEKSLEGLAPDEHI
jgi:hypothetical protein